MSAEQIIMCDNCHQECEVYVVPAKVYGEPEDCYPGESGTACCDDSWSEAEMCNCCGEYRHPHDIDVDFDMCSECIKRGIHEISKLMEAHGSTIGLKVWQTFQEIYL